MKKLAAISMALAFGQPSYAQTDDKCEVYGDIAGAVVDFLLPLTLQQLVNMTTGKDPVLAGELTKVMTQGLPSKTIGIMARMDTEEIQIISHFAGQNSMQLIMGAQATSAGEAAMMLKNHCYQNGSETLISNFREALKLSGVGQ